MPERLHLGELAAQANAEPPDAVPPPRFTSATFASYRPTDPSQAQACRAVREFVTEAVSNAAPRRWPWQRQPAGRGLYLDGGYGVGKTHLLAAVFHAAAVSRKAYLTFQELVHLIGALGREAAEEQFADVSLLCLDEFELDDPGNTLIIKRFLERLFASGGSLVTTSNTPPEAQGSGRFNAEDFRREIQGIASRFTVVSLEGGDYRRRERTPRLLSEAELENELARVGEDGGDHDRDHYGDDYGVVTTGFPELVHVLRDLHPIRYRALLSRVDALFIRDVETIPYQNDALRFVHLIDQLYDRNVGLRASGEIELGDLFDPSYRHSAYQKKHERCVSRLGELLSEPLAVSQNGSNESKTGERASAFD